MNKFLVFFSIFFCNVGYTQVTITPNKYQDSDILIGQAIENGEKKIYLAKGIHFFSQTLIVNSDNISISGDGLIKVRKSLPLLLDLNGNNVNLSLNVDGENKLSNVMKLSGNNISVFNCSIKNLYAKKNSSVAILINSNGYFNIKNNLIENIYSEPDFKLGNGVGMARAISIVRREKIINPPQSFVINNKIYNIMGEEGDAVTLLSKSGDRYTDINTSVLDNNINNYSRRAIKVQANNVLLSNNSISNTYKKNQYYNCSSAISIYAAKNITIKDNSIVDKVCASLNVLMLKNNPNINDVGNIIINNNKVFGSKMGFKVGDFKISADKIKESKIKFMSKNKDN